MTLPRPFSSLMSAMHKPIYNARLRELVRVITPHLQQDDRILDVGCGVGTLGKALLDDDRSPPGLVAEGLERVVRGGEPITVHAYDGGTMPFEDKSYDVVMVADVLHHEPEPDGLIAECCRVARRMVIIKDHQIRGILAQQRVSFMDWAANAPYGVPCLFRYNTPDEWTATLVRHGLSAIERHDAMRLYPPFVNTLFGGKLQFMVFGSVSEVSAKLPDEPCVSSEVGS